MANLFDTVFQREKARQASFDKIMEACHQADSKVKKATTGGSVIPKNMKGKIEYAKEMSIEIFGDKLNTLELVTREARIREYFSKIKQNGIVAVDTETNGLDRVDGIIAGLCLYTPGEKGIYIPLRHISYMTKKPKDNANIELVADLVKQIFPHVKTIYYNAKFDCHFLYWNLGYIDTPYWDTHVGACMLDENEPKGLKNLWTKYCGEEDTPKAQSFNKLFKNIDFREVPPDVAYMYGANDPIITFELYEFQAQYLDETSPLCQEKGLEQIAKLFHEVEMPMLYVAFISELKGVCIDMELAQRLHDKYKAYEDDAHNLFIDECAKITPQIKRLSTKNPGAYKKLSNPISISSSTQLAILLYDILKFESSDPSKPRGTGDDIIAHYEHPIVDAIRQYRKFSKALSTYIDAIPNAVSKADGKLHARFNTRGARTGRLSSDSPNLQNIPSKPIKLKDGTKIDAGSDIRQLFCAGEGNVFVGSDFSQQEPRTLAYLAQEETMLQAYKEGLDLYSLMASDIYGVPYDECKEFRPDGSTNKEGKERRNSVKSVLLGIMYGRGASSIAEQLGITKKEAEKLIIDFFRTYPKIAQFIEETQDMAREYGYVLMAWGGKRRLPDMQLDEIDLIPIETDRSHNFDALNFDDTDNDLDDYVPDEVWYKYAKMMRRAWSRQKKNEIKEMALEDGYKLIDNGGKIADAERQCVNSVIQGSSAIMSKKAVVALYNHPRFREIGAYPTLYIHDEIICTCPKEYAKECKEIMEEVMVNIVLDDWGMTMKCDVEVTERWYGEGVAL